jgi:hypothetical protein
LSGSASDLIDGFAGTVTTHTGTVTVTTSASTSQLATIDAATTGVITVARTEIDTNAAYDLTLDLAANGSTSLANFTGLTTIDASAAGNAAMTITAADIFGSQDTTGNLTLNITGTDGGGDTLDLSEAESWSTSDGGSTYTATGNFDGVAGNETYTINITDIDQGNITIG